MRSGVPGRKAGLGYSPHSPVGAVGKCLLIALDEEGRGFLPDELVLVAASAIGAADREEAKGLGAFPALAQGMWGAPLGLSCSLVLQGVPSHTPGSAALLQGRNPLFPCPWRSYY